MEKTVHQVFPPFYTYLISSLSDNTAKLVRSYHVTYLPSAPFETAALWAELQLVKKHKYVRNGHLTLVPGRFALLVVSNFLHTWYKQQVQHARALPNTDASRLGHYPAYGSITKLKWIILKCCHWLPMDLVGTVRSDISSCEKVDICWKSFSSCCFTAEILLEGQGVSQKESNCTCLQNSHTTF